MSTFKNIEALAELYEKGVLSLEEFAKAKSDLLSSGESILGAKPSVEISTPSVKANMDCESVVALSNAKPVSDSRISSKVIDNDKVNSPRLKDLDDEDSWSLTVRNVFAILIVGVLITTLAAVTYDGFENPQDNPSQRQ